MKFKNVTNVPQGIRLASQRYSDRCSIVEAGGVIEIEDKHDAELLRKLAVFREIKDEVRNASANT